MAIHEWMVWQKKRVSPLNLSLLFLGSKKVSGMLHRRRMSSCESSKRLSRSQSAKRYRKNKSIIGLVLTVLPISGWAGQSDLLVINLKATESSRSWGQPMQFRLNRLFTEWLYYVPRRLHSALVTLVPNRRACTFIDFDKKIPPARPYFVLHVYCLKSPCTFIFLAL